MSRSSSMTLPVLSGSMMPFLHPGGEVLVECTPSGKCHLGDIIVFRETDKLVAHRVLFRLRLGNHCYLYQKGDAAGIGHWVRDDRMIGVVTRSTDANGTELYLRGKHNQTERHRIYVLLVRDVLTRAKSVIKAFSAITRGGGR